MVNTYILKTPTMGLNKEHHQSSIRQITALLNGGDNKSYGNHPVSESMKQCRKLVEELLWEYCQALNTFTKNKWQIN